MEATVNWIFLPLFTNQNAALFNLWINKTYFKFCICSCILLFLTCTQHRLAVVIHTVDYICQNWEGRGWPESPTRELHSVQLTNRPCHFLLYTFQTPYYGSDCSKCCPCSSVSSTLVYEEIKGKFLLSFDPVLAGACLLCVFIADISERFNSSLFLSVLCAFNVVLYSFPTPTRQQL